MIKSEAVNHSKGATHLRWSALIWPTAFRAASTWGCTFRSSSSIFSFRACKSTSSSRRALSRFSISAFSLIRPACYEQLFAEFRLLVHASLSTNLFVPLLLWRVSTFSVASVSLPNPARNQHSFLVCCQVSRCSKSSTGPLVLKVNSTERFLLSQKIWTVVVKSASVYLQVSHVLSQICALALVDTLKLIHNM